MGDEGEEEWGEEGVKVNVVPCSIQNAGEVFVCVCLWSDCLCVCRGVCVCVCVCSVYKNAVHTVCVGHIGGVSVCVCVVCIRAQYKQLCLCWAVQEASVFVFEKKSLDRFSRTQRDVVLELLKKGVSQLTRLRHPKILSVLHPLEDSRSVSLSYRPRHLLKSAIR